MRSERRSGLEKPGLFGARRGRSREASPVGSSPGAQIDRRESFTMQGVGGDGLQLSPLDVPVGSLKRASWSWCMLPRGCTSNSFMHRSSPSTTTSSKAGLFLLESMSKSSQVVSTLRTAAAWTRDVREVSPWIRGFFPLEYITKAASGCLVSLKTSHRRPLRWGTRCEWTGTATSAALSRR